LLFFASFRNPVEVPFGGVLNILRVRVFLSSRLLYVQDFVGPENKEEEDVHLLRYTLITRINSTNELVCFLILVVTALCHFRNSSLLTSVSTHIF
jgi:hypothetical protein